MSLVYLTKYAWVSRGNSLWTDELFSINHYSSGGPVHAATTYSSNNHVLFNILASLVPGEEYAPWRVRLVSYVAILLTDAALIYEFIRRRWILAGAVVIFALTVNYSWLNLIAQGRGYALLGLAAVICCLAVGRYLEDSRRRWLVGLAIGTLVGVWAIPTFVIFAGPLWLALLGFTRRRDVVGASLGTAVAIAVAYAPIAGPLQDSFSGYAAAFGRNYTGAGHPFDTMQMYLFHAESFTITPETFALTPLRLTEIIVTLSVVALAFFPFADPFPRTFTRVLAASIVALFAICLYLQTPPDRTVSFVIVPFLLVAASLLSWWLEQPMLRRARPVVAVGVVMSLGVWGAVSTVGVRVLPNEDWRGVSRFVNAYMPADLAVGSRREDVAKAYLDPEHRVIGLDRNTFALGKAVFLADWSPPPVDVSGIVPAHGEISFRQLWGAAMKVLIAPPMTSNVSEVTANGRPLDVTSVTGRAGAAPPIAPISTASDRPLTLTIVPSPGIVSRSVVALVPIDSPPQVVHATVLRRDGSRASVRTSDVVTGRGTVTAHLGDHHIASVTLVVAPVAPTSALYLRETWIYPSR